MHQIIEKLAAPAAMAATVATAASVDPQVPWQVFTFVFTAAIGAYTWFAKRQSTDRATLVGLQQNVAVASERMKHLPTQGQVFELNASVRELSAQVGNVDTSISHLNARLGLVEEFLKRDEPKVTLRGAS